MTDNSDGKTKGDKTFVLKPVLGKHVIKLNDEKVECTSNFLENEPAANDSNLDGFKNITGNDYCDINVQKRYLSRFFFQ